MSSLLQEPRGVERSALDLFVMSTLTRDVIRNERENILINRTFVFHYVELFPAGGCDGFVSEVLGNKGHNHITMTILKNEAIENLKPFLRRSFLLNCARKSWTTPKPIIIKLGVVELEKVIEI